MITVIMLWYNVSDGGPSHWDTYQKGQNYSKFTYMYWFQAPELLDRVEYTKSVSWN